MNLTPTLTEVKSSVVTKCLEFCQRAAKTGIDDHLAFEDSSFLTQALKVRDSEVQTELTDIGVTVKRDENETHSNPHTVVLRYQEYKNIEFPPDYSAMSSPVILVYQHVVHTGVKVKI